MIGLKKILVAALFERCEAERIACSGSGSDISTSVDLHVSSLCWMEELIFKATQ